ncbi:LysR family transcriptional regulator [Oceanibacterium hippocampi]|uniref:HTH-type transcriptional regulator CysL n=1 Tax=Oceanibacterium hippocampi TaxID=745714 RepID=A0A1Y5TWR2_9PROT|nr:LysR family transcriptional regulator [Oceanibacterium hippocampi]SLN75639.1 HTH-type transcriptional regulator CysL [Oceanibacterium hippocampi]
MRLTLAQIETFYWIARLGSFHAAARQLCVTQPSVSGRIREMERDLGYPLFDRSGAKVRLTESGKAIQAQAEQMLTLAREIQNEGSSDKLRGLLRLGVVETVAHLALPGLIRELNRNRPRLRVELAVDVGAELLRQLDDRQLDVAITTGAVASAGIVIRPLGDVDLAWMGPVSHPLAGQTLTPAKLVDQAIFAQSDRSTIGSAIREWFDTGGLVPNSLNCCNSLLVTSELVAAGLGFAVITPSIIRPDMVNLIRRFDADPPIQSRLMAIAALKETWSEEVEFIGNFVAGKFRELRALQ